MTHIPKEAGDAESWFVLGVGDGVCDPHSYDAGIFRRHHRQSMEGSSSHPVIAQLLGEYESARGGKAVMIDRSKSMTLGKG